MAESAPGEVVPVVTMEKVRFGQKLLVFTVGLWIASVFVKQDIRILVLFVALILSLFGTARVTSGLGYSTQAKVGWIILMLVPIVNFIALFVLNSRANGALRGAGYTVGLFGAKSTTKS